jgi:hypothetical protein
MQPKSVLKPQNFRSVLLETMEYEFDGMACNQSELKT